MREPDSTMLVIAVLIICSVLVAITGIGYEIYLDWYIKN